MTEPPPPTPDRDPGAPPTLPPRTAQGVPASLPPDSPLQPPISLPQGLAPPDAEERNMGMLTHLLAIFTGFVAPLVIWLVKKDGSPFLDHHGKEAVNFQITYFLITLCTGAASMVIGIITMGLGMLLIIPVYLALFVLALVWEVQACTAASRGEWHRYPVCFRFIV